MARLGASAPLLGSRASGQAVALIMASGMQTHCAGAALLCTVFRTQVCARAMRLSASRLRTSPRNAGCADPAKRCSGRRRRQGRRHRRRARAGSRYGRGRHHDRVERPVPQARPPGAATRRGHEKVSGRGDAGRAGSMGRGLTGRRPTAGGGQFRCRQMRPGKGACRCTTTGDGPPPTGYTGRRQRRMRAGRAGLEGIGRIETRCRDMLADLLQGADRAAGLQATLQD